MLKLKTFASAIFTTLASLTFAQEAGEGVMRITHNPSIIQSPSMQLRSTSSTFDSTFIFTVDTLTLPIFDDFSTNLIQQYEEDFSDPTVTSQEFFRLLDTNNVPLAATEIYTSQQTFRRTFDVITSTVTTTNFPAVTVQKGDLSVFPVFYTDVDAFPPYYIYDTIGIDDVPDTIWIVGPDITQASARQFFKHVTEPSKIWKDAFAYHNYRFPKDPWSIGVMTFDGVNDKGFPYEPNSTVRGVGDYLTSKPINLASKSPADSVYLSFLFQKQGLGENVEDNDSLILEFYDSNQQLWKWMWSTGGEGLSNSQFYQVQVPVKLAQYFTDAFQFRFKNYCDLSGSLDHYHLDYVHLRDFSGYQDTLVEDFAVSYPLISLLKDYTSVPWDHYKLASSGKMATDVSLTVRNSYLNGGNNISSAGGGKINILYDGVNEGTVAINGQSIVQYHPVNQPIPDYSPRTTYTSTHDVSSISFDPAKPGNYQEFTIQTIVSVPVGSNYQPNDTASTIQHFRNYYAYDDGTAELAYGPYGAQSRLAIRYEPYVADSVIGAYMHFVPTVNNVTSKLFQLVIWDEINGKPGNILYEDEMFELRQPSHGWGRDNFVLYFTKDSIKVPVDGAFYIGWRQLDAMRLGVGLDQNTDKHENTFYSLDGGTTWEQSQIPGSVMIRPIFSTALNAEMSIKQQEEIDLTIYPNPTNGLVHINAVNGQLGTLEVYNLYGQLIETTQESTIDLSKQPEGIYLIKSSSISTKTYKVVKTR